MLAGCLSALGYVNADSIWDRRDPKGAFLFVDSRARHIGDIVTILIQETTGVNNTDQRKMSKDSTASGTFNYKGSTQAGAKTRSSAVAFSSNGEATRTFQGSAAVTINQVFTDRLAVTVVDVLPNGNLVIEGFRKRNVDREERIIRITGIVRPNDILLNDTVLSQSIANFQITYLGQGADTRFTNQNYLSRIINWIWPF
jgi:flagellar L-ring protein precursor FlgH